MSITIKRDDKREVHTHSRKIDFEGVEPILLERNYSHGGKHFLPTAASIFWKEGETPDTIKVYGPVLKKDGTPGHVTTDMRYNTPASRNWGMGYHFASPDAPAWLLELFDIEVPRW